MTRAEQRLNSNHGRLMRAAAAIPERLRDVPIPGWGWTPRDALAHVIAWQEEAILHLRQPDAPWGTFPDLHAWNHAAHRALRSLRWDDVIATLEANHSDLRELLGGDPPRWFGRCTYRHYTDHTRDLLAFVRSFQSPTTTVVPMAAQS